MARYRSLLLGLANATLFVSVCTATFALASREVFGGTTPPPNCALPAGCAAAPCPGTLCIPAPGVTGCAGCTSNASNTCSC
jgi:hypothetical protein